MITELCDKILNNPRGLEFSDPTFDFGLTQLKQMKELEQEKDSLLTGLEAVERARDWYQGQIHNVTERQRQVGQSSHCTVSSVTRQSFLHRFN